MTFYKYQGTGNDFIIVDNRLQTIDKNDTKRIAELCDRRFGIGADGFILLENHDTTDFKMVYYNADGNQSSMCGNGARCITAFAQFLNIIENSATFMAVDGLHKAKVEGEKVHLQMQSVTDIEEFKSHIFLDTGSPHHIEMVEKLSDYNVKGNGSKIRYGQPYNQVGSNVNFVEQISDKNFKVRTYERGVEDETLSCGTGVTAVALGMHKSKKTTANEVDIHTPGGELKIKFQPDGEGYKDIWLIGPAKQVFKGEIVW